MSLSLLQNGMMDGVNGTECLDCNAEKWTGESN